MRLLCALVLAAASLTLPAKLPATGLDRAEFGDRELQSLLQDQGYHSIERLEPGVIKFSANSDIYLLYRYGDGDLQLYYGVTGVRLTFEDVNAWNTQKRLSRAYLDGDHDPVLEADLLANGGLGEEKIAEFVRIFVVSAAMFQNFVLDRDRGEMRVTST